MSRTPTKAALKWPGAKRWLVPLLRELWDGQRVVEFCAGSLSISLGLSATRVLAADSCKPLVNFHRCLQAGFELDPHVDLRSRESVSWDTGCMGCWVLVVSAATATGRRRRKSLPHETSP